jgi:hypothetical protein
MSEFNGLGGPSTGFKQAQSLEEDCKESLLAVIEKQIIPRLLNVQQFFTGISKSLDESEFVGEQPQYQAFTQACLKSDSPTANAIVDHLTASGVSHERIFLELITPAARQLGVLWEQDLCDFTQKRCLLFQHRHVYHPDFPGSFLSMADFVPRDLGLPAYALVLPGTAHEERILTAPS